MKKYVILTAIAALLGSCTAPTESQHAQIMEAAKTDLSFLASDALEGRETGTKGAQMAAEYVAKRYQEIGLSPILDGYYQEYTRNPKASPHVIENDGKAQIGMGTVKPLTDVNVLAELDGLGNEKVIIGAHFDHLGYGGTSSLSQDSSIHNGADDNASGVAVMLALAQKMKSLPLNKDYVFLAFSGEEQGLWGSNYFVKNPPFSLDSVDYMINMDMVGRMKEKTLAINGIGTTPGWMGLLEKANKDSLKMVTTESGVGPSDHTSFYNADIPVLHIFTGQHEDYHKSTDDYEKINFEGIDLVTQLLYELMLDLDDEEKLVFSKTVDQNPDDTPAFKVTLGVIPDYLFSDTGMRIDGVSDKRPASNAGLQKGDIVIQMGEIEVIDMMSYMEGLNQFEPGDTTMVTVKRNDATIQKEVVFD